MPCLSVVIITYNEEQNIERCLQSVRDVADEILVVDSYSSDGTENICKQYNVRFIQHPFDGYIEQKNWATAQAQYDYVLFLDADEALSDTLRQSVKQVKANWTHDGYTFNRLTNYCGHWIRHTSWYPSRKLRLFDRRKGQWDGINPHDQFILHESATIAHLRGDLLHYSYYTIEQQLAQINNFTEIIARSYYQKGFYPIFLWHVMFHPIWRFFRDYFIKLGFLDGFYGFVISINGAYEVFLKYLKIYHHIRTEQRKPPYRLCFVSSSGKWNLNTESFFNYLLELKQNGVEFSLAVPYNSMLYKKARAARMNYFNIGMAGQSHFSFYLNMPRLVKYFKLYRVAAIITGEKENLSFTTRCARWAKIHHIFISQEKYGNITAVPSQRYYYLQHIMDGVFLNSDIKFYTYLINHYELVTIQNPENLSESITFIKDRVTTLSENEKVKDTIDSSEN